MAKKLNPTPMPAWMTVGKKATHHNVKLGHVVTFGRYAKDHVTLKFIIKHNPIYVEAMLRNDWFSISDKADEYLEEQLLDYDSSLNTPDDGGNQFYGYEEPF